MYDFARSDAVISSCNTCECVSFVFLQRALSCLCFLHSWKRERVDDINLILMRSTELRCAEELNLAIGLLAEMCQLMRAYAVISVGCLAAGFGASE